MANLLADKKRLLFLATAVFGVLFVAYILIPSNLPKPFYIEVARAQGAEDGAQPNGNGSVAPPAGTREQSTALAVYPKMGDGIMYDVGSRIVNLLDPVGRRYLKVTIVLEFLPPDYAYYTLPDEEREDMRSETLSKIEARKPVIDDLLTSLLTSKSYEDIYNLDGKNRLRAEIQERLSQVLGEPQVIAVYFTDFIVQ
jgi:flagellar FliL protein